MGSTRKGFSLLLIVTLAISSLIMIESAFAQTTGPLIPGSPGVGGFSVLFPSNGTTLGVPIEVMVSAFYANGYYDKDFAGHVSFSASKGIISPSTSGAFTEGSWRGLINMSEAGSDIVVYVNDGNGHTGKSSPISVYQPGPTPTVPEFSSWTIPLLLTVMVTLAGFLVYLRSKTDKH